MRKTIAACAVTALAVGGTTATAASLITSEDITDGTIQNRDIRKDAISHNRLTPGLRALIAQAARPSNGTNGKDGANGTNGAAGAKGETGSAGAKGDAGATGATGPKGDAGDNGTDGLDSDVPRDVTASNLRGWTLLPRGTNPDPTDNGVIDFAPGLNPPLGTNALHMATVTGKNVSAIVPLRVGSDKPKLSELTTATFSAYKVAQPTQPNVDVALKITILGATNARGSSGSDPVNNPAGFTTLVFEGAYNRDQNADATGAWQRWYVRSGKLWSSRGLVGAPNG